MKHWGKKDWQSRGRRFDPGQLHHLNSFSFNNIVNPGGCTFFIKSKQE